MTDHHLAPQDSIDGITDRLREWISLREPGMVWIRYASDLSRKQVLDRLTTGLPLPRFLFEPADADQAGPWLEQALSGFQIPDDALPVVAVLCPFEPPGAKRDQLISAFQSINLRREPIARLPLIQLWWIPLALAPAIELAMPDLLSWCKLRLWLNQFPEAAASEEVERFRKLASDDPEGFSPKLLESLRNFGNTLSSVGRREDALMAAAESVSLARQSAAERPADLGSSLNALSNSQCDLGKR